MAEADFRSKKENSRQRKGPEDLLVDPINTPAWPRDENGEPMLQIYVQARDHVGLENFSNVTVGPSGATAFIRKGQDTVFADDDERHAFVNCLNELSALVEVDVIANQRDIMLNAINPGGQ